MELNLIANGTEQTVIKEYLEQNASDILAEKINNGVVIEQDGKKLLNKKTLDGFMKFAGDEAKKQAKKGATSACVADAVVFGWAIHYFEEAAIIGTLYNEDGSEYIKPKPAPKTKAKKATNTNTSANTTPAPTIITPIKKEPTGQMTMFDLFEETETAEAPEEVAVIASDEPTALVVDTQTGEVIEQGKEAPNPYADLELMHRINVLLDWKIDIVKE